MADLSASVGGHRGVKLRLPRLDGTYSLGFLFLLYGVAHFSLPETLLAVCAGAVAGSLLNTKNRSSAVQVLSLIHI